MCCSPLCICRKKVSVTPKKILDSEIVKYINFIKSVSLSWIHVFVVFCVMKWKRYIKHICCTRRYCSYLKESLMWMARTHYLAVTCYLSGYVLAGSWNRNWSWDSNPGVRSKWDTDVPRGILTTLLNTCLLQPVISRKAIKSVSCQ